MYCSLRFFIDKTPDLSDAQNILSVFELFANVLEKSYDCFSYVLFDPNSNGTLINKKYSYDSYGKNIFLSTSVLTMFVAKNGELTAPFITATCETKANQIYSKIRTQIEYPTRLTPLIIKVDYKQSGQKVLTLEKYNILVQSLKTLGFIVNNGFYHVYRKKNEVATLDGGQIGTTIGYWGHQNLRKNLKHRKKGCLNSIMGVYCANSICINSINKDTLQKISNIIGNNIIVEGNICSFALDNMEKADSAYRIKKAFVLKKIEYILRQGGL